MDTSIYVINTNMETSIDIKNDEKTEIVKKIKRSELSEEEKKEYDRLVKKRWNEQNKDKVREFSRRNEEKNREKRNAIRREYQRKMREVYKNHKELSEKEQQLNTITCS